MQATKYVARSRPPGPQKSVEIQFFYDTTKQLQWADKVSKTLAKASKIAFLLGRMLLGLVYLGRRSKVDLASIHQRFAQGRVRMDRFGQIANFTTHLDG